MHSHQLQIPAKTYLLSKSFAGVRSPKRGKLVRACVVRSRVNEISQVERILFSKVHFFLHFID